MIIEFYGFLARNGLCDVSGVKEEDEMDYQVASSWHSRSAKTKKSFGEERKRRRDGSNDGRDGRERNERQRERRSTSGGYERF